MDIDLSNFLFFLQGYEGQQQEMLSLSTSVTEYEQKSLALQDELNEAQGHSDIKQQAQAREVCINQETKDAEPLLPQCWASIEDGGTILT